MVGGECGVFVCDECDGEGGFEGLFEFEGEWGSVVFL